METTEFHQAVRGVEVSMATQGLARELIASMTELRVDAALQTGDYKALLKFPVAACLDMLDSSADWITRKPKIYHLNRELGFSPLESLRHTSADTGLATAVIVLVAEDPSTVEHS